MHEVGKKVPNAHRAAYLDDPNDYRFTGMGERHAYEIDARDRYKPVQTRYGSHGSGTMPAKPLPFQPQQTPDGVEWVPASCNAKGDYPPGTEWRFPAGTIWEKVTDKELLFVIHSKSGGKKIQSEAQPVVEANHPQAAEYPDKAAIVEKILAGRDRNTQTTVTLGYLADTQADQQIQGAQIENLEATTQILGAKVDRLTAILEGRPRLVPSSNPNPTAS